jgi:hypothetical protein
MDWRGVFLTSSHLPFLPFRASPLLNLGIQDSGTQFVQASDCQIWNRLRLTEGGIDYAYPGNGDKD